MRALVGSLFAVFVLASIGCGPKVQVRSTGAEVPRPNTMQDMICVARAADGRLGSRRYTGTGELVSERIVEALRVQYPSVKSLSATDEDDAADTCRTKHGRYLIVPAIRHWEDRYSGWSWKKDRIEIRLSLRSLDGDFTAREVTYLANTSSGVVAREVLLTGWTNEQPDELLTERFDAAVLALVSGQAADRRAETEHRRAR
jgi:hypothetical protein